MKEHPFFKGIDWQLVYLQKYPPPLIPPRGEVNAADAFDIGSFDEEDTKGIKLSDSDQDLYKHFPVVISERWQQEISETVYDAINSETDKIELKKRAKLKNKFEDEKESDCILHGYIKKLGGPFASAWQNRYAKLYPNRLELHSDSSSTKPELIFMDQIEGICSDYVQVKGEQTIVLKMKGMEREKDARIVLTNTDEIGLREWLQSLKSTHKDSLEMLSNIAKKATKIYGAENRTLAISTVGNSCITTAPPPPVQLTSVNSNGTAVSNHHPVFTGPGPIPALGLTGQANFTINNNNNNITTSNNNNTINSGSSNNNNNNNNNNNTIILSNHLVGAVPGPGVVVGSSNNNSSSVTASSPTSLSNTHMATSTSSAPAASQMASASVLPPSAASAQPRNST